MRDQVAGALILLGAMFALVAAVGTLRLPDIWTRVGAATKAATLATILVAGGATLALATFGATIRLVLVVALQELTAPLGAHLVGRAVHATDPGARAVLEVDELGTDGTG